MKGNSRHEVQRSARYPANGVREIRWRSRAASSTAGNPMITDSEIVKPSADHADRRSDIDRTALAQHEISQ